jgi:hypothetical protein
VAKAGDMSESKMISNQGEVAFSNLPGNGDVSVSLRPRVCSTAAVRIVCLSLHSAHTGAFRTGRLAMAVHAASRDGKWRFGEILEIGNLVFENVHSHMKGLNYGLKAEIKEGEPVKCEDLVEMRGTVQPPC